jgi:uncharacterized protein (UPF0332 family)
MINQTKDEYIKYRLTKAFESFEDAKILAKNERWNACVNRLYYSLFYAVIALLLNNGNEVKTHDGARNQFNLFFVKEGKITKESGKLFSKLFDWRQKGDYGDLYDFAGEQVVPLIEPVENFLKNIKELIS